MGASLLSRDNDRLGIACFGQGVRVAASVENVLSRSSLDNLAGVHHADPIGHFGNDGQIVGNQNDRHIEPLFKLRHEREDLGLNRDIKGGGGSSAMSSLGYKPWPEQSSRVVACRLRTQTDIGSRGAQLQGYWLSNKSIADSNAAEEKDLDGLEAVLRFVGRWSWWVERGHGVLKDHANVSTSISSALSIG